MAKNEIKQILAERLNNLMEKKRDIDYKLSDKKQAQQMDIPYNTFNNYRYATSECPISALVKMAKYFHVSTDYLLGLQREPTNDPDVIAITEYTGLTPNSIENLNKYKTTVDREYMCSTTNEDGEPCFYTSSIGSLYHDTLKIINELIINEDIYTLAKLLHELEFDSYEYFNQIEIRKNVHQKLYGDNGEYDNRSEAEKKNELVRSKKEKERMHERIDLDRYRLTEFIIHLSDRYDQREQVKSNGKHNPANK